MSQNKVVELPDLTGMASLRELYVSDNALIDLPDSLCTLSSFCILQVVCHDLSSYAIINLLAGDRQSIGTASTACERRRIRFMGIHCGSAKEAPGWKTLKIGSRLSVQLQLSSYLYSIPKARKQTWRDQCPCILT